MIHKISIIFVFLILPLAAHGEILINEVMYDLEGADTDREWVEIINNGSDGVDLTGYKFFDGTNHTLNIPPKNGGTGDMVLGAGELLILSGNAETFISEHSGLSVSVIDTVMALSNTSAKIAILDQGGAEIDSFSYTSELGGKGDGNSLQKISGVWKATLATPGANNVYTGSINSQEENTNSSSTSSSASSSSGSSSAFLEIEPKIFADIESPKTVMAGADAYFSAQAYGSDKEPMDNAKYLWNFGDGSFKDGQNIMHSFVYPGDYVVFLYASSGKYSATDRSVVKVIPPQILISDVSYGDKSAINITNKSNYELDISSWRLRSGGKLFSLPKNTFILPGKTIMLSSIITGIYPTYGGLIEMLYPNGQVSSSFSATSEASQDNNQIQNSPENFLLSGTVEENAESLNDPKREVVAVKENISEEESTGTEEQNNSSELSSEVSASNLADVSNVDFGAFGGLFKWLIFLFGLIGVAVLLIFSSKDDLAKGDISKLDIDEKDNYDLAGLDSEDFEIIGE